MYRVQVFYPDEPLPRERHQVRSSAGVLAMIPRLLAAHDPLAWLEVYDGPTFLFAVDCDGDAA